MTFEVVREVTLPATAETVWGYLSTEGGWSALWGAGSTIAAVPGARMAVVYPNGLTAGGVVQAVEPPRRIRFTWGYDRPGSPIPPEGSAVEIVVSEVPAGTWLQLTHRVDSEAARDLHVPGWRYQLGLFRDVIARRTLGPRLAERIDAWHAAWSTTDVDARRRALDAAAHPDVTVDEPMAALAGIADVDQWIGQMQGQFPAVVRRTGPPVLNADAAMWDWVIESGGASVASGRSVAVVAQDGRFRHVSSFWLQAPPGFPTSVVPG